MTMKQLWYWTVTVHALRERMGESTRQVEESFESLWIESFGG
jgi:hypothetical protein